jgi:hypothetical protein
LKPIRKKRKKRQVISKIKHPPFLHGGKIWLDNVASLHNHYKLSGGALQLANDVMIVQRSPKQNPCKNIHQTTQQTNKQKNPKITRLLQPTTTTTTTTTTTHKHY